MSRVEDDRQEQRVAEQRQILKQQQEAKAKEKQAGDSAFAKKLQDTNAQKSAGQQRQVASGAYESILDEARAAESSEADTHGNESTGRAVVRQAAQAFQDKLRQSRAGEGERMGESRLAAADTQAHAELGRAEDQAESEHAGEGRASDSRTTREGLDRAGKGSSGQGAPAGRPGREGTKADADGGGQKGSGNDKGGGAELGAGFRFNPALMAPVPVARPKDTAASERLRKLAMEIAQKIVERARVGTNAAGKAEFQIELRSNVLSGLSIKVSGGNGKISATFSGSDKEVLKLLEENKEGLKSALASRGLTLEDLKIEAKG